MKNRWVVSCVLSCAVLAGGAIERARGAEGPPTITRPPASQTIFVGDPVTFTVGVDGTEPFTYHWYRNGNPIAGANGSSHTIAATALGDNGASFQVAITNALGGAVSAFAELRIDPGNLATNTITLLPFNASWRYNQANTDLGTPWKDLDYNDTVAGWNSGPGVFDAKTTPRTSIGGQTVGTQLVGGNPLGTADYPTFYFRTHFNLNTNTLLSVSLSADVLVDDSVALYLNGQNWVATPGVNFGDPFGFAPNTTVGDATVATYPAPSTALVNGDNLVAAQVHQVNVTSSDITFGLELRADVITRTRDTTAPTATYLPGANSTVRSLPQIEVRFSEDVQGVDAADLLINNMPATELQLLGPEQYVFRFPTPSNGTVQVTWASGHGITDLSASSNAFAGGSFIYILDPNANFSDVRINEFMAANDSGIADEDGDTEDWIELFNGGSTGVNLAGWYLTDDPVNLRKWQFPTNGAVNLQSGAYLIVWASEKNKRVAGSPLHTNFKLEKNGEYLALVLPDGTNVVSAFAPRYPVQFDDVSYGRDRIDPSLLTYFSTATPGTINSTTTAGQGVGPEVRFSRKSGTFRTGFSLELSIPSTNFVIRYFLVTNAATAGSNNVPSATSPIYTGPIAVNGTIQVRARAYPTTSGYFAGPSMSETYLQIDAGAAAFTSDLPVIIWHNFGGGVPPSVITSAGAAGVFMVFDTNNPTGLTSLTNPPALTTRAGAHIRGSSTEGYAKKNLGIEFWTEVNRDDNDEELMGMPADSDWVLYAPNQFDRNYLHNPVAMALGRELGHYASRTRFAEFFLNTSGGVVTYPTTAGGNYNGVYVVMEKIKANDDRVDVARLDPQDTNATTITGGYVMKVDRNNDPDDVNNFTPGSWSSSIFPWITTAHAGWNTQPVIFHDPDGLVIGQRPQQRTWFINYISQFEAALTSASNWTNPVTGYRAYIDEDQWIENHMLNIFPFNVDGYRLSGYFYKERDEAGRPNSGKLKQGPLWDYDRSQGTGSVDPRPFNPRQWKRPISGDQGTDLFGNNDNSTGTRLGVRWWWQMFHDPNFWQRWVDRWQDLRDTPLWTPTNMVALLNDWPTNLPPSSWNTTNVLALIDALANQVRQAQPRNAARWPSGDSVGTPNTGTHSADGYSHAFTGTYQGDIDFLKKWWSDRLHFVETNFLSRPVLSNRGGQVSAGYVVTVTAPGVRVGTVTYYTLDGTDPRLPGGAINPSALSATAPFTVTINQNARLFARNRNPNHSNLTNASLTAIGGNPPISTPWSGSSIATYVVATPPLRISEIMYDPFVEPGNTNDPGIYEYVELVNVSGGSLSLVGFRFTNGIDFTFTATNSVTSLAAGGRVLVVKNRSAFLSRYPALAGQVAGEFTGSLDNSGERVALIGPLWEPIHDFRYENTWYPATEGSGFSLVPVDENAPLNTWTNQTQWRASAYNGGSPGAADPTAASVPVILVNEILTHSVAGSDVVELFNPKPDPVDVGHWYLTDNRNQPQKYRIPADTIIPGNGFRLFYESNSFGVTGTTNAYGDTNGFGFSSSGEEVYVFSGDSEGRLTGYFQGFDFGPAMWNVTFGRYTNSVTNVMEVAQSLNTLGGANAYPMVGPLVINEIMAYPPNLFVSGVLTDNFRDEFIEVRNISDQEVLLYDTWYPANRWQIQQAVEYKFPIGASVPPNGYLLVVSFDPAVESASLDAFRARYGLSEAVPIYGPYTGHLANEGERLELRQPGTVNPNTGVAPMVLVDRVDYSTNAPWPTTANGTGASLQRRVASDFGNDPANWVAAAPSGGGEPVSGDPPTITTQPQPQNVVEGSNVSFSLSVAGTGPFYYQWFLNSVPLDGAYSQTLILDNVQLGQAGNYSVFVLSGSGTALSSTARLTVRPLPVITQHPASTNVYVGSNATFRVTATTSGGLSYQWQFNSDDLPGRTGSTLTITNAQPSDVGAYRVTVSDTNGSLVSQQATLAVWQKMAITTQPESQTLAVGSPMSLSVEVSGTPPYYYRWRKNTGNISWPEPATLDFTSVVLSNAGTYDVIVTNQANTPQGSFGHQVVSGRAYVAVVVPPTNQVAQPGDNVTLRAIVSGPPASYTNRFQWLFNGTVVTAGTNFSTTASPNTVFTNNLVITNVSLADVGSYTFMYSNLLYWTNRVITTNPSVPPTYTTNWVWLTNILGAPAAFTATLQIGSADTDGDGMPDDWEQANGLVWTTDDAALDADDDGLTNLQEYQAGTDPQDADSLLKIIQPELVGNDLMFQFLAVSNRTYRVEFTEAPDLSTWSRLTDYGAESTNRLIRVTDPVAPGTPQRTYRVRTP